MQVTQDEGVESELWQESLALFRQTMRKNREFNIRVAKRVTLIIRLGMILLAVTALGVTLLVYNLARQFDGIMLAVTAMHHDMVSMRGDMAHMERAMFGIERSVSQMPLIEQQMAQIHTSMVSVDRQMEGITVATEGVGGDMRPVLNAVDRMQASFVRLDRSVYRIGREMETITTPLRPFNQMLRLMPMP